MELRVLFDSVEVNNPKNWRDISIKYERDEVIRGLFTFYTSILEFTGDAYDAFIVARESQLCEKIDADLEIRCSRFDAWETLFSGVILVQDSKNLACDGLAEVTIEQNDVNHFFFDNRDFEVELDGTNDGPGVQAWNDLPLFNVPAGNTTGLPGLSYGYPIDLLFSDILERNGSGMGFISSLLTTVNQSQVINIDFTVAPAAGDTVQFIVTDEWGHQHTYEAEADATAATTWNRFERVLLLSDPALSPTVQPTKRMGEAADVVRSTPGGGVIQRFAVTFHFATTVVSISAGSGSATTSTATAHVFGADAVRYADSSSLRSTVAEWYVFAAGRGAASPGRYKLSFEGIFQKLAAIYDLGLSIVFDAGTWKVRVEESEFFLDPTSTLTIRNVKGIVESYDDQRFGSEILLSYINNEEAPNAPTATPTELTYDMPDFDCDDQLDRRTPVYNNEGEQIEQDAKQNSDPDSEYLVYSDGNVSQATQFKYRLYDSVGAVFQDDYYYNIPIAGEAQILRNQYTLPSITYYAGDYTKAFTVLGGYTYTALEPAADTTEGDGFAPVIINFEKSISFDDFKLIVDSQRITVNETDDPANDFDCFIESFEYRVFEHSGVFELSTKDS